MEKTRNNTLSSDSYENFASNKSPRSAHKSHCFMCYCQCVIFKAIRMIRCCYINLIDSHLNILTTKRSNAQHQLANYLGWQSCDASDLSSTVKLDCLYDCIMFCVNRGFQWSEVCHICHLVIVTLDAVQWRGLPGTITVYKSLCEELQGKVDALQLSLFNEFFVNTYMTHHQLYQMVLSSVPARDVLGAHLRLPICQPPVSFPPLNLGKDLDVWQYENVISSLEAAEQESQQKRRARKEMEDQDDKANIVAVSSLCNELLKDAVDRQTVLRIIQDVAAAHISAATHVIQHNVEEAMDDVGFMLDKTAVPRPQALGPPPRYDVKSALVAPKTAQGSNKQTTNQKGSAKSVRVSSGKLSKTSKH